MQCGIEGTPTLAVGPNDDGEPSCGLHGGKAEHVEQLTPSRPSRRVPATGPTAHDKSMAGLQRQKEQPVAEDCADTHHVDVMKAGRAPKIHKVRKVRKSVESAVERGPNFERNAITAVRERLQGQIVKLQTAIAGLDAVLESGMFPE